MTNESPGAGGLPTLGREIPANTDTPVQEEKKPLRKIIGRVRVCVFGMHYAAEHSVKVWLSSCASEGMSGSTCTAPRILTSALDGCECPATRPAALPLVVIEEGAGWVPEPVLTFEGAKNPLPTTENRNRIPRCSSPQSSHCNTS